MQGVLFVVDDFYRLTRGDFDKKIEVFRKLEKAPAGNSVVVTSRIPLLTIRLF